MKLPTLQWDSYRKTREMLEKMEANKKILEIIAGNKSINTGLLLKLSDLSLEALLERLDELHYYGVLTVQEKPLEYHPRIITIPSYSINWKMIKAINKAFSTL